MSRKRSKISSIIPILILGAAIAIWIHDAYTQGSLRSFLNSKDSDPVATEDQIPSGKSTIIEQSGRYDAYHGCTLVNDRGNDGDSFRVLFPDGKKEIIRLYFVDTPESAFKTYGGGQNNHRRIQQQADDMGEISSTQAVEIGKNAKKFTLSLLEKSSFTIYTEWDSPFNDKRYHAYVEISDGGRKRFLHELLVENGLARIHTKGAAMPDGTSERQHEDYLLSLRKNAKSKRIGAWGF